MLSSQYVLWGRTPVPRATSTSARAGAWGGRLADAVDGSGDGAWRRRVTGQNGSGAFFQAPGFALAFHLAQQAGVVEQDSPHVGTMGPAPFFQEGRPPPIGRLGVTHPPESLVDHREA